MIERGQCRTSATLLSASGGRQIGPGWCLLPSQILCACAQGGPNLGTFSWPMLLGVFVACRTCFPVCAFTPPSRSSVLLHLDEFGLCRLLLFLDCHCKAVLDAAGWWPGRIEPPPPAFSGLRSSPVCRLTGGQPMARGMGGELGARNIGVCDWCARYDHSPSQYSLYSLVLLCYK